MAREPIRMNRLDLMPQRTPKKRVKARKVDFDPSKYFLGFFFDKSLKEDKQKLGESILNVNIKDVAYERGTFGLVIEPTLFKGSTYYGLGGVYAFCLEIAGRYVYEYVEMGEGNAKNLALQFADTFVKLLIEIGKENNKAIRRKIQKSMASLVYYREDTIKTVVKDLVSSYYDIVLSKIESKKAKFVEVSSKNVMLVSKETLVANMNEPDTEINSLEAYIRWLKKWVDDSADQSFVLQAINQFKDEVEKFVEDKDLAKKSPDEIQTALYLEINGILQKILLNKLTEEESSLYKSADRILNDQQKTSQDKRHKMWRLARDKPQYGETL